MTVSPVNDVNFPEIKETGQSLDSDFYFTGEVSGIKLGKNIRFRERFEDKSGRTTMRTTKYELNEDGEAIVSIWGGQLAIKPCLLYTSPSPRDLSTSRMPSSA